MGFYAGLAALLVELDDAGEYTVVGDSHRGHTQLYGALHQRIELARPIQS
jgi:hypothetical protein